MKPTFRHDDSIDSTGSVSSLSGTLNHLLNESQSTAQNNTGTTLNSVGSSSSIDVEAKLMNQEGVFQLTKDIRKFSEALASLKTVFLEERGKNTIVVAHDRLSELLVVLKLVIHQYAELNSAEILSAATELIKQVKGFNYEDESADISPDIFRAINNLAMAFCTSVSECLMGDFQINPPLAMSSSQSFYGLEQTSGQFPNAAEVIADATEPPALPSDGTTLPMLENVDDLLQKIKGGLDMSFDRAKLLSKYLNELISYVKKKANIEIEHSKAILKLSQATLPSLSEQSFLPFQSLYCTALDHDREFASNCQAMYMASLLQQKFIEPLQAKKNEHDRKRKAIRDSWLKEKRKSEEAITNMKKAKQTYQARVLDYTKAKEAAIRAEGDQSQQSVPRHGGSATSSAFSSVLHSAAASGKMEKKRKLEEDANLKANQAEHNYKAFVNEANKRVRELEKNKVVYLQQLRDLIVQCDQTAKTVTVAYFQHHYQLFSPLPVQFQAMAEDAKRYEPGFQYSDYIRNLPAQPTAPKCEFQFEPCSYEGSPYRVHPPTLHPSKNDYDDPGKAKTVRRGKMSDTESSSSRSMEDLSPSTSPSDISRSKTGRRPSTEGSVSSEDLVESNKDVMGSTLALPADRDLSQTPNSSPVAKRSQMTKQAARMVSNVKEAFKLPKKPPKPTVFGVDFGIAANDAYDGIPFVVKSCIAEIDNRALTIKGIYRINGVKNRVEKICAQFELSPNNLDLSAHSPHDVSSVLKCFLRQLPEPLLRFDLYTKFLQIGKDYQQIISETNRAANQAKEQGNPPPPGPTREVLDALVSRIRDTVRLMPEANQNTLQYIIAHLTRVAAHSRDNKMTASNLAIVFGPTLMRQVLGDGNESLNMLIDMPFQSRIVEMLIDHKDFIFGTHSHQAGNIFPFPGFHQAPSFAPDQVDEHTLTPDSAISETEDLAASVSDLSFHPGVTNPTEGGGDVSNEHDILLDFGDAPDESKQSSSENYSTNLRCSATNLFKSDLENPGLQRQPSLDLYVQEKQPALDLHTQPPRDLQTTSNGSLLRRKNANLLLDLDSPGSEQYDDVWTPAPTPTPQTAAELKEGPDLHAPVAPSRRTSKTRRQRKSTDDSEPEASRSRSDTLAKMGRRFSQFQFKRPSLSKSSSNDDPQPTVEGQGQGRKLPSLPNHVTAQGSTAGRTPPQVPLGQSNSVRKSSTLPLSVKLGSGQNAQEGNSKPNARREILVDDGTGTEESEVSFC